jgi:hypothetical protein
VPKLMHSFIDDYRADDIDDCTFQRHLIQKSIQSALRCMSNEIPTQRYRQINGTIFNKMSFLLRTWYFIC